MNLIIKKAMIPYSVRKTSLKNPIYTYDLIFCTYDPIYNIEIPNSSLKLHDEVMSSLILATRSQSITVITRGSILDTIIGDYITIDSYFLFIGIALH